MFIALLNFLLAVVVNAFTEVQAEMDKCKIELNLLPDVWYSFSYYWHRVRSGWPDRSRRALALFAPSSAAVKEKEKAAVAIQFMQVAVHF